MLLFAIKWQDNAYKYLYNSRYMTLNEQQRQQQTPFHIRMFSIVAFFFLLLSSPFTFDFESGPPTTYSFQWFMSFNQKYILIQNVKRNHYCRWKDRREWKRIWTESSTPYTIHKKITNKTINSSTERKTQFFCSLFASDLNLKLWHFSNKKSSRSNRQY